MLTRPNCSNIFGKMYAEKNHGAKILHGAISLEQENLQLLFNSEELDDGISRAKYLSLIFFDNLFYVSVIIHTNTACCTLSKYVKYGILEFIWRILCYRIMVLLYLHDDIIFNYITSKI